MEYKPDTYSRFNLVRPFLVGGLVVCVALVGCTKTPSEKSFIPAMQPRADNSRVEVVTAVQKDVDHTTSQPATVHPFF